METPFPLDTPAEHFIHTTYLDSLGRPAIRITKSLCTEKCGEGLVYVSSPLSSPFLPMGFIDNFPSLSRAPQIRYHLSPLAQWQKTFAVAAASMALFGGVMVLKRALGDGEVKGKRTH